MSPRYQPQLLSLNEQAELGLNSTSSAWESKSHHHLLSVNSQPQFLLVPPSLPLCQHLASPLHSSTDSHKIGHLSPASLSWIRLPIAISQRFSPSTAYHPRMLLLIASALRYVAAALLLGGQFPKPDQLTLPTLHPFSGFEFLLFLLTECLRSFKHVFRLLGHSLKVCSQSMTLLDFILFLSFQTWHRGRRIRSVESTNK